MCLDYSNCKIYKIVCKNTTINDCYVGHTCNWTQRKAHHKQTIINNKYNDYYYKKANFIRENGGWNNWKMILVEEYSCNTKLEAEQRERYWIEILNSTLNTVLPRTVEESKKLKIDRHKQYNIDNKNIIYNKNKLSYNKNKNKYNANRRFKKEQFIFLHILL